MKSISLCEFQQITYYTAIGINFVLNLMYWNEVRMCESSINTLNCRMYKKSKLQLKLNIHRRITQCAFSHRLHFSSSSKSLRKSTWSWYFLISQNSCIRFSKCKVYVCIILRYQNSCYVAHLPENACFPRIHGFECLRAHLYGWIKTIFQNRPLWHLNRNNLKKVPSETILRHIIDSNNRQLFDFKQFHKVWVSLLWFSSNVNVSINQLTKV